MDIGGKYTMIVDNFFLEEGYEEDVLRFRFEELNKYVDYFFVITNLDIDFRREYGKFFHKIVKTEFLEVYNELLKLGLEDGDLVLLSDYNQVPNKNIFRGCYEGSYKLEQEVYHYDLYHRSKKSCCLARLINFGTLKLGGDGLNDEKIVKNGGWCFRFGEIERVKDLRDVEYVDIRDNVGKPDFYRMLLNVNDCGLTRLGVKYMADVGYWHGYTDVYGYFLGDFREREMRILLLGMDVLGSSLMMWSSYFVSSEIWCVDVEDRSCLRGFYGDRVKVFVGGQNRFDLGRIVRDEMFDVIVDWGSHEVRDQVVSLGFLFRNLNEGGIYFVESLQTSLGYQPEEDSALCFLEGGLKGNRFVLEEEILFLRENVEGILVYEREKVPVICYGCKEYLSFREGRCDCGVDLKDRSILGIVLN